jgi:hypothetical protein
VPVEDYTYERNKQKVIAFKGLVALAHERWGQDGFSLKVEMIQQPNEMNGMTAICSAHLRSAMGAFQDIGDASPANVGRNIAPHFIRMAATRAMGRVLRIALNVSAVSAEELVEEMEHRDDDLGEPKVYRGDPRERPSVPDVGYRPEDAYSETQQYKDAEAPVRRQDGEPGPVEGWSTPVESGAGTEDPGRPIMRAQMKVMAQLLEKQARLVRSDPQTMPQRFEQNRAEKPVREMTVGEANEWIERLVEENESYEGNGG